MQNLIQISQKVQKEFHQLTKMPSKPSSIKKDGFAYQWSGNVDMHNQNLIKIYHVVPEL